MEIAVAAVTLLAPYLAKAASAAAESAGESALGGVRAVFDLVRRRFEADDDEDAKSKLAAVEQNPEDSEAQTELARVLSEKIDNDPAFASELQQAITTATGGRSAAVFNNEIHGEVGNIANVNVEKIEGGFHM